MTDQHTFESPEYTQDELIAALQKLGAEIKKEDSGRLSTIYGNRSEGLWRNGRHSIEAAHEFLRTDPHGWMAMDALFGESKLEQQEFNDHTEFHYEARGYKSHANSTRQAAVYDVFMQYIREELKK